MPFAKTITYSIKPLSGYLLSDYSDWWARRTRQEGEKYPITYGTQCEVSISL